jgi:hypothetical protein
MTEARQQEMLNTVRQIDSKITKIVEYSKFVVAYLLVQEGQNQGWQKANIEGPVYIVQRQPDNRSPSQYKLIVMNQQKPGQDLEDSLHPDWELDIQKNYVFYKIEDQSQQIRGLWFHDDAERTKIETVLEKTLGEIRSPGNQAPAEPQTEPQPRKAPPQHNSLQNSNQAYQREQGGASDQPVVVTKESLRTALHALADDDTFLRAVMQKLRQAGTAGS